MNVRLQLVPDAGLVPCTHCALPVPNQFVDAEADVQFCCNGCKLVYETIHGCGLARYYELRDGTAPSRQATVGGAYESYDEASFRKLYVRPAGEYLLSAELYLEAVHCAACVWLLEKTPELLDGLIEVRLDIGRQVARLVWDPRRVRLSQVAEMLDSLGYRSHPYRPGGLGEAHRHEERGHLIRIAVAGACAGNVMLIAFALYGGSFNGMEPQYRDLFRWSGLFVTLIALLWPGGTFLRGAWSSVRTRRMHIDFPVALALVAGTVWGTVNTIWDRGDVYFESVTAVIFLLLVGRWIQFRQKRSAQDSVEWLYRLTPSTARKIDETGAIRETPSESLEPGDRVELRAGDAVPADGCIAEGRSDFDLSLLTGESRPVTLGQGERVHAGTNNLSARVVLEVENAGAETRVGRLMAMVEQFARNRPPIVHLADRVAHYFVIVVVAWAFCILGLWLYLDPSRALENAIALLIVTCPCALGLATPLAVVASIGSAARRGILIKGGEVLERLSEPGIVFMDKTGTVTQGRMRLIHWAGDDSDKPSIVALESGVAHPVAGAFVSAFEGMGRARHASDVSQVPGGGVVGTVGRDRYAIGSPRFVGARGVEVSCGIQDEIRICLDRVLTPVVVARNGAAVGVAGFGDPLHDDARQAVGRLRTLGWEIGILSGDHPEVVDAVARDLGIPEVHLEGAATPERKAEVVQAARARYHSVMMVGDGINDAAALSAAGVGVAVRGGAEASLSAADVFLRRPGLAPVVELAEGAPRAVGVIKRNLTVSLLYNLITAGLASVGLVDPLLAAVLMPLSSLTVVMLSYRSRTFDSDGDDSCQ